MKMYNSVLERVRLLEEKNGIYYAKVGGKLYNTLKVLYIIAFSYTTAINLLYFLGMLLQYSEKLSDVASMLITPAVCAACLIAGLVFLCVKFHIVSAVLSIVPSAILIFFFIPLMEGDYVGTLKASYYYRHLAPLALIIIFSAWLTIIALRAKIKTRKQYNRVSENIYNMYKVNIADGEVIDEAQWEEFLEKFDPRNYNEQFIKKEDTSENA